MVLRSRMVFLRPACFPSLGARHEDRTDHNDLGRAVRQVDCSAREEEDRSGTVIGAGAVSRTDEADSLVEGDGFEPSVPGTKEPVFVAEGELRDRTGAAKKGCFLCGTDGSNPSPSSSESGANLSLAGIRLPTSRSRGFPRVCGPGRAARSAETHRTRQHRAYER